MRRIRYCVAASLDGYIAGPNGEADWIIMDSEIDFDAIFGQFDTLLIGRRTFEAMGGRVGGGSSGMKAIVFSRTLNPADYKGVTIFGDQSEPAVAALREQPGKDIWLWGGGGLFRSLLGAGLVDTVEVAIIPVLLGGGIPLLPPPTGRAKLQLTNHKVYKSGIVSLEYAADRTAAKGRRPKVKRSAG